MTLFAPEIQNVPVRDIDGIDSRFRMRFARPTPDRLRESIDRSGLLEPVLLSPGPDGKLTIVHGFARMEAALDSRHETVLARIAYDGATETDLLIAVIETHLAGRALNRIERAMALQHLANAAGRDFAVSRGLPLFGEKPSPNAFDAIVAALELPGIAQIALAHEEASEGIVTGLLAFDAANRQAATEPLIALRMSTGASRRFLRELLEVCRRDDATPAWILHKLGFDPQVPPDRIPESRQALLDALHLRRYPVLTSLETQYADTLRLLDLGANTRLHPPRDFEGERYRLEADLRGIDDFEELARRMNACLADNADALRRLFDPRCEDEAP